MGAASNILPTGTALILGGGTLGLTGTGTQTVGGLTTTANTASAIVLDANETLTLGALTSIGAHSALNFNTAAGGASGTTLGSGVAVLNGLTAGSTINPNFTVTDSTGFGLATVDAGGDVLRVTTLNLLPPSGATPTVDYTINNNAGGAASPGSSNLLVTSSETAHSVTVDTTASGGVLTLSTGVILKSDIWNFGGVGSNAYSLTLAANAIGAGLESATAGGAINFNNYNTGVLTISTPILDNGISAAVFGGTGTTILTGASTYAGGTSISGTGVLQIGNGGATGSIIGDIADNGIFIVDRSGTLALSGAISGSGTLTQAGSGTLILSGNNSYSGRTTVASGTLLVNNTAGSGTGTSAVNTINSGATLGGGSGTIGGDITLNSGRRTIAPGAGRPGVAGTVLHGTTLTWNPGGTLAHCNWGPRVINSRSPARSPAQAAA